RARRCGSNHGLPAAGVRTLLVTEGLAESPQVFAEFLGEKRDVARMHDQVRTQLAPLHFLLPVVPEVDADAHTVLARRVDDVPDVLQKERIRILLRDAQA